MWSLFEIFETIIVAIIAVVLVRSFVVQPFVVSGASMEPTFFNGNYLLVDELTYMFRNPDRGEVIVFRYPGDLKSFYIKRIIGLPGERVIVEKGKVSIYKGEEKIDLNEAYIGGRFTQGSFEVSLGDDEFFVMGDNRNFSFDSRNWGPLPKEDVVGIVRVRLWPIYEVQAFSAPLYNK